MLKALLAFLGNGEGAADASPARRFVLGVAGTAALALNHKLGLNMDVTEQGILAGTIATLVLGSSAKEAHQASVDAKAEALKAVPNVDAAVEALRKGIAPSPAAAEPK